jgi:PAS domain S-box-containing protein
MSKSSRDKADMITYFYEAVILGFATAFFFFIREDFIGSIMIFSLGVLFIFYRVVISAKSKNKKMYDDMHSSIKDLALILNEDVLKYDRHHDIEKLPEEIKKIKEKHIQEAINKKKILKIVESVAVNMELDKLLEDLLPKLCEMTKSTCCAIYLINASNNKLEIKKSIGFSKNIYSELDIQIGEGFVGSLAKAKKVRVINDIPEDTVYLTRTFLGTIRPKAIMTMPIINNEEVIGVFLMSSLYEYTEEHVDILNMIKNYVGVAVSNSMIFEKTKRLTNELKFQNSLIENLSEDLELKVKNRTRFLDDILNSCFDYGVYTLDNQNVITYFSKGAENIMGHLAKDMVNKNIEEALKEEYDIFNEIKTNNKELYNMDKFVQKNLRHNKDGEQYNSNMVIFLKYDEDKNIVGYVNIITKVEN